MWIVVVILVIGYFIFEGYLKYTESNGYKQNKWYNEKTQLYNNSKFEIEKMEKSEFFRLLTLEIKKRNRASCMKIAKDKVTYKSKITPGPYMFKFDRLQIHQSNVWNRGDTDYGYSEHISFKDLNYKDITDSQVQVLGMALMKSGMYISPAKAKDFSELEIKPEYWYPIANEIIDKVHKEKTAEYNQKYKSVY